MKNASASISTPKILKTGNIEWNYVTSASNKHSKIFYVALPINPSMKDFLEIWIYKGHFLYPKGWCIKCPKISIDIDVLYADFDARPEEAAQEAIDLVLSRVQLMSEAILKGNVK